ncbi:hypothetical protein [Dactylosporangium sp. CA-139066]|uniref:hypothetical protein n=1 Tax=Dactylosporangium sp. CA-139066 TaxID=3239930 RepID=UPI003D91AAE8
MSSSEVSGRIRLAAAQPGLEFVVRDGLLATVAAGTQRLDVTVEPGLYQIERRAGDATSTDVVLVPPGGEHREDGVRLALPCVAPVSAADGARPEFRAAAEAASAAVADLVAAVDVTGVMAIAAGPRPPAGTGALVVAMCQDAPLGEHPHHRDVELLDSRGRPVPAWRIGWRLAEPGIAAWGSVLPPGGYSLRARPAGADAATNLPVYVAGGWQTVVFCLHGDRLDRKRMSVNMTPLDVPWRAGAPSHTAAEAALAGLRRGRPVFGADVTSHWLAGADPIDPMVGILTAHALRVAGEAGGGAYDGIVGRLRELLPDHPDVTALAMLRDGRIDPGELSVSWPPMLLASYRDLILPADLVSPSAIIDGSAAERIAGRLVPHGPWLAWSEPPSTLHEPLSLAVETLAGRLLPDPVASARVTRFLGQVAGFEGTTAADVRTRWSATDIARATELPTRAVSDVLSGPPSGGAMRGWGLDHPRIARLPTSEEVE